MGKKNLHKDPLYKQAKNRNTTTILRLQELVTHYFSGILLIKCDSEFLFVSFRANQRLHGELLCLL